MAVARFAPLARTDLWDIRAYIAAGNPEAARQTIGKIKHACLSLATQPFLGRVRNELLPDLRSFPVGSYVIFYDVVADGVEIVRVLHGARDLPGIFGS